MPNLEVLELLQRASEAPQNTEQSPERLSFWVATMLPLTQRQSLAMLTTRSTLERLQLELEMLQGLRPSISGCTIC